jgi:hypothetical protein
MVRQILYVTQTCAQIRHGSFGVLVDVGKILLFTIVWLVTGPESGSVGSQASNTGKIPFLNLNVSLHNSWGLVRRRDFRSL